MNPGRGAGELPLALLVGVGEATGASVCRRLAAEYRIAMVARTTDITAPLAASLPGARAFSCDVGDPTAWTTTLATIRDEMATPARVLFNVEGGDWGAYTDISLARFAASFDVNVVSLLVLVQTLYADPAKIADDTRVVVSSSPAAYTSLPMFLGIAPSRAAQRVLAETLHEILAPQGLRFCVLSIDGAIDEPGMRSVYPNKPDGFFIQPDAIADKVAWLFADETPGRSASITSG